MKSIGCKINIKSFDSTVLEYTTEKIKRMASLSGIITLVGPVRLPKKIKRWTVLRSPHIDKKSREQFEMITYRRMLIIKDTNPVLVKLFLQYIKKNVPIGVGIAFKEYTYESLDTIIEKSSEK